MLWDKLRQPSRTVEVLSRRLGPATSLNRTQGVLQAWITRDPAAAKAEAADLRQALADANWGTIVRHGGFDAVVDKIDHAAEETAASAGASWADNFRLRGSWTWRRTSETATTKRCSPSRFIISTPTTLFSQWAEPLPLWRDTSPKRRIRRGTTRISRVRCEKEMGGCASRDPAEGCQTGLDSRGRWLSLPTAGDGHAAGVGLATSPALRRSR